MDGNEINKYARNGAIVLTYDEIDECVRNNARQTSGVDENGTANNTANDTANSTINATENESESDISNDTSAQQTQGFSKKYRHERDKQILHVYLTKNEKRDFERICYERGISMSKQAEKLVGSFVKKQKKKELHEKDITATI